MDLAVQQRQKFGKAVKVLRREGLIPAELYGHGLQNMHLSVSAKDFLKVFKEAGTNTVINLSLNKEKRSVLVHGVETDYLSGGILHVDFYQVRMDEKIKARIPIEFIGIAPAVKDKGGILNKSIFEIEVEALPADLPHKLEVDLSALKDLNESIYIKDIKISPKVEILVDVDMPVVSVTEPRAEEVVEAAPVDVSAVKVETEEKKAEREAEKPEPEKRG